MAKTKKKQTTKALSDRKLFDLVSEFETNKERATKAESTWRSVQTRIVEELRRRKVKSLTDSSLTKITLVAPETVVYNEDDLWADLSAAQRKQVFDRSINLNALPADVQKELVKSLTPAQRKRVISHKLNVDRLAEAVQDGKVAVETVSEHSEIKESAGYIRVSRGETS